MKKLSLTVAILLVSTLLCTNALAQNDDAENDSNLLGFGGKIKATFGPATFGIQYASKTEGKTLADGTEDDDITMNSMGGYTTLALGTSTLGGGVFYTTSEVDGSNNTLTHTQYHISYAHPLMVENVTIKYAIGGATAIDDTLYSSALSFRVRLVYDF